MIVRFPAYRRYSAARIEVNDAMMALLIGARLGEHALANSAAASDVRLPQLFGQIPGIQRVNRTAGDAARLLGDAELHLAYMAIPYAMAIHSAFLVSAAKMVRDAGNDPVSQSLSLPRLQDLSKLSLDTAHEYIAERCGGTVDGGLLALFHLSRRIRNRIIHFGGTAGSSLAGEYKQLPKAVRDSWESLAGRKLTDAIVSDRLVLAEGELIAVLATSHRLARSLNDRMAHGLSRAYWASVAVRDYRESHPQRFGERARRLRRVQGHAATLYGALQLTEEELRAAGA